MTQFVARNARWILCAATVLIACAASLHAQANDYLVSTVIDGGNAIVFATDHKSAIVGAVASRIGSDADFNDHDMDLVLQQGKVISGPPPTGRVKGRPFWRLNGFDVRLCPNGQCLDVGSLEPKAKQEPTEECVATLNPPNGNLYYVPHLLDFHPGSKLVTDWRNRLQSRLHLQQGTLFTKRTTGCFTFRDHNGAQLRRDAIAHGNSGLHNEFRTDAKFVEIVFSQAGKTDAILRVEPHVRHGIQLNVSATGHTTPDKLKAGDVVTRLKPFYELIDMRDVAGSGDRRISIVNTPLPNSTGAQGVNPGSECPMVALVALPDQPK